MKYYVYFDSYGHAQEVIDEKELAATYSGDTGVFLRAMGSSGKTDGSPCAGGHVGTLNFDTKEELKAYLESLGDEITGFYGCCSESRPYNF